MSNFPVPPAQIARAPRDRARLCAALEHRERFPYKYSIKKLIHLSSYYYLSSSLCHIGYLGRSSQAGPLRIGNLTHIITLLCGTFRNLFSYMNLKNLKGSNRGLNSWFSVRWTSKLRKVFSLHHRPSSKSTCAYLWMSKNLPPVRKTFLEKNPARISKRVFKNRFILYI